MHLNAIRITTQHTDDLTLQAEEVRRVADSELGFQQVSLNTPTQAKTFLFVNTDRMVVGCLVAEHIRQVKPEALFIGYETIQAKFFFRPLMFVASWCLLRLTESWSNQIDRKTWQRTISWKDTEPGAAPPFQSRLSAGSVGSGCSVLPGGWALPPACWTQSGNVCLSMMCENNYSEMSSVPSIHILSLYFQEHIYVRWSSDQRWDCLLRPHTWWQTLCYEVL